MVAHEGITLQTLICKDFDNNPVDETEWLGMKQLIKITKHGWILLSDKSGLSTSQKKDGHVCGRWYIVPRGTILQTIAFTTDHRFSLLPCTSASGEAVCCIEKKFRANKVRFLSAGGLVLTLVSLQFQQWSQHTITLAKMWMASPLSPRSMGLHVIIWLISLPTLIK